MKSKTAIYFILLTVWLSSCATSSLTKTRNPLLPKSKVEVASVINKVNTYWQEANPNHGWAFWDVAAYHTGNMEAYKVTQNEEYRKYSEAWAKKNQWMGAKSNDKSEWKYSYGEKDNFVLFGDWQICFQTYIDLYQLDKKKDPKKIARAREVMEYQMSTPKNDYWWWADGLYIQLCMTPKKSFITATPNMFTPSIKVPMAKKTFGRGAMVGYLPD